MCLNNFRPFRIVAPFTVVAVYAVPSRNVHSDRIFRHESYTFCFVFFVFLRFPIRTAITVFLFPAVGGRASMGRGRTIKISGRRRTVRRRFYQYSGSTPCTWSTGTCLGKGRILGQWRHKDYQLGRANREPSKIW